MMDVMLPGALFGWRPEVIDRQETLRAEARDDRLAGGTRAERSARRFRVPLPRPTLRRGSATKEGIA